MVDYLRQVEISQAVDQSLAADFATDAWGHAQLEIIRRMCIAFEDAMRLEDVPRKTRDRVRSTVLLGDPDGIEDLHRHHMEQLAKTIMQEVTWQPWMEKTSSADNVEGT